MAGLHLPKVVGGVTAHSELTELDFASAAHTDFLSTNTAQNVAAIKTFTAAAIFQNDVTFDQDAVGDLVIGGLGSTGQITLAANLDQDDHLIKRDVDGDGSTYSEAGSVLVLQRDVTNVSAENGNFLECQTGSVVFRVSKEGRLYQGNAFRSAALWATGTGFNLTWDNSGLWPSHQQPLGKTDKPWGILYIGDDKIVSLGTSQDTNLDWSTAQATSNTVVWGLGTTSKSLLLTDHANINQDHDVAAQSTPTLFIFSDTDPDSANDEWISLTHDVTDGVIAVGSGVLNVTSGAAIGDGRVTNYTAFGADGLVTLFGTARRTRHDLITNADLGKGSTAPSEVIVGNYTVWNFGIGDDAVLDWDMPTDWAVGTDVEVHIHWQIDEAFVTNSGEVQWQVLWSATPHDETEAIDAPTHSGTLDAGDQNIPATAKQLTSTTVGTIPGASLAAEDSIGLILSRVALDAGNNPAAEPGILHLEIHYVVDSFGEA